MRVVIQRVKEALVSIDNKIFSQIKNGYLIYLGIENADNNTDIEWLTNKIMQLRIFSDNNGLMNKSIIDIGGEILVVSQFTLHAKTKKGNRPSFIHAAKPDVAIPLYQNFIKTLEQKMQKPVKSGKFGANMQIMSINDGPVTILIDTKNKE